jgi:hypothetical protein
MASLGERVKKMTADGLSARQIASRLGISPRHVRRLRAKNYGPGKGAPEDDYEVIERGRHRTFQCECGRLDVGPGGASLDCLDCGRAMANTHILQNIIRCKAWRTPDGRCWRLIRDSGTEPGPETLRVQIVPNAEGFDDARFDDAPQERAVDHPELCGMIGYGLEDYFRDWEVGRAK